MSELIDEVVKFPNGIEVLTGNKIEAPAPPPPPAPEPEPAPTPEPEPVVVVPEPAPTPVPMPELEFAKQLFQQPELVAEIQTVLNTDYNSMSAKDLFRLQWLEENKNISGVSTADFDAYFEKRFYNFDPTADRLGLEIDEYLELMRKAESAKSQFNTRKAETAAKVEKLREVEQAPKQPETLSPEEQAKLAEAFRKGIEQTKLGYDFVPSEVAQVLDPNLPEQYKAKFVQENLSKELLGLERFVGKDGNFDVPSILDAMFKLDNLEALIQKTLEHGKSLGRAEGLKDVSARLDSPLPPGSGANTEGFVTLPNGMKVKPI